MSDILKVFSPEQLVELMKNKIIADDVGLTNFNVGSRILSLIEAVALVESSTGMDYIDALRKSIPVALYDGLGFDKKDATVSTGYIRFYRLPTFFIVYTGVDSSNKLNVTATHFTTTTSGTPADDLNIDFATYDTIQKVIDEINAHGSYTASLVNGSGTSAPDIYQYSDVEIVGSLNYRNNAGRDIMEGDALEVIIIAGGQFGIDDVLFQLTASDTIPEGDATSPPISAQCLYTGPSGNIQAQAIDTINGKGFNNIGLGASEQIYILNDSAYSGGQASETDEERAVRFQTYVQGLSNSTVFGIESAVLEVSGIKSVSVRENYPTPGQITVVADDGSGNLSIEQIDEIDLVLSGDPNDLVNYPGVRAAGITINIEAPTIVPVNVTVTVTRIGNISDTAEIQLLVQSAIENYINTRKLGDDVVIAEIIKLAKSAHPAVYDLTVSTPSANVSINDSSISRTGSGTGASVTVNITTIPTLP